MLSILPPALIFGPGPEALLESASGDDWLTTIFELFLDKIKSGLYL